MTSWSFKNDLKGLLSKDLFSWYPPEEYNYLLLFHTSIKLPYRKLISLNDFFLSEGDANVSYPVMKLTQEIVIIIAKQDMNHAVSNLAILFQHFFFSLSDPFVNQLCHIAGSLFNEFIKPFACAHCLCEYYIFCL